MWHFLPFATIWNIKQHLYIESKIESLYLYLKINKFINDQFTSAQDLQR